MTEEDGSIDQEPMLKRIKEAESRFLRLLDKFDFDKDIISTLQTRILPGLQYEFSTTQDRSRFIDVGMAEFSEPDGRYHIVISSKTIDGRAGRLKGVVPEGEDQELALDWILGHELGHAVLAAYGLLHKTEYDEGLMAGMQKPANSAEDYLNNHPSAAMSDDKSIAITIEKERQCEGFSRLVLENGLIKYGLDMSEAKSLADKIYEDRAQQAPAKIDAAVEDPWLSHEVGYAHPLSFDELVERFAGQPTQQ